MTGNNIILFQVETVTKKEGQKKEKKICAIFKLISAKTKAGINVFVEQLVEEYAKKIGHIQNESKGEKLKSDYYKEKQKSKCYYN